MIDHERPGVATRAARHPHRRIAWPSVVLIVGTVAALVGMAGLSWGRQSKFDTVAYGLQALALVVAGVLILRHRPRHRIGVVLVLMGVGATIGEITEQYTWHPEYAGAVVVRAVANCTWLTGAMGYSVIALLFPTGRLPGRRWSVLIPVIALGGLLAGVGGWFGTATASTFADGVNPYARGQWADTVYAAGTALLAVALLATIASLVGRYRRGASVERQQIRLFAYALGALAVVGPLAIAFYFDSAVVRVAIAVVVTAIPCAVCVSILRYRLYGIDRAAQAALVYGIVTLVLGITFALATLFIGTAIGRASALATAGATLCVAVAFNPLRHRVQDLVDRRFRRARHDALAQARSFMDDLRVGNCVPEDVGDLLRRLLGDPTMVLLQSTAAGGWIDERGNTVDSPDTQPNTVLVESGGHTVGALLLRSIEPDDRRFVSEIVRTTALAVAMVRLRTDLALQLAAVEASRTRIVEAAEEERRRIQRDLHDGAQQRLVSVGLVLRHAQHQMASGSADTMALLDDAVQQVLAVIAELREMASGSGPSQLDHGLEPALQDLASRARPTPVVIDLQQPVGRMPRPVEAAAYFVACEGLTNAIKHARASRVVLGARREGAVFHLTVHDDGNGGAQLSRGTGLRGLVARVQELGGTFRLDSPPGSGTTIEVEFPCAS